MRSRAALKRTLAAIWCFAVLAASHTLHAQPQPSVNQKANEVAQRLGRERSAEGLETIIATRNPELLGTYTQAFQQSSLELYKDDNERTTIPDDVESVIVRHYAEGEQGAALRMLIGRPAMKYRTRALFDLMYTEWRSGRQRNAGRAIPEVIFATDLRGIEAPALELLRKPQRPGSRDEQVIVSFLGERKYAPAVPVLASLLQRARPDADGSGYLVPALLQIGTADAVAAVVSRLAWLGTQPSTAEVTRETDWLVMSIAQAPAQAAIDYDALKHALPAQRSDAVKGALLVLTASRKERKAVPDVLPLLAEPKFHRRTLEVLIDLDSPEVWKEARAEVERLKDVMGEGQYRYASSLLDGKIANPATHFAEKRRAARYREFEARRGALLPARNAVQKLKDGPPEPYIAAYTAQLAREEQLAREYADLTQSAGLRSDVAAGYAKLGTVVRFRLKEPQKAIELYGKALESGVSHAAFAIGDTLQFDLHDNARALDPYRRMVEEARRYSSSTNELESGSANWMNTWFSHQAEYLKTGRRFSGTIGRDDVRVIWMFLFVAGAQDDVFDLAPFYTALSQRGAGAIDRKALAQRLDALPASGLTLIATLPLTSLLPDADAILRYFDRHDPAGYATACFLGLVEVLDRIPGDVGQLRQLLPGLALPPGSGNPMRVASAKFMRERNISLKLW